MARGARRDRAALSLALLALVYAGPDSEPAREARAAEHDDGAPRGCGTCRALAYFLSAVVKARVVCRILSATAPESGATYIGKLGPRGKSGVNRWILHIFRR
jgi:hypothetical protein